jgi:hypothetical protein
VGIRQGQRPPSGLRKLFLLLHLLEDLSQTVLREQAVYQFNPQVSLGDMNAPMSQKARQISGAWVGRIQLGQRGLYKQQAHETD